MANSASSKKRVRQNEQQRSRNRVRKAVLKGKVRTFVDQIHDGELAAAKDTYSKLQKELDQISAKGTIHRKTAARRKSRLALRLNKATASAK